MATYPALPLWTDAYLSDTRHLSAEEHGAYLLLLMEAWRRPRCTLPDDDVLLAKLVGVTPQRWGSLKPAVMAFWTRDKRRKEWRQKRLTKERKFVDEKSRKQRDRAVSRWNTYKKHHAAAMPERCRNDAPRARTTPTPTPTPSKDSDPSDLRAPPSLRSADCDLTLPIACDRIGMNGEVPKFVQSAWNAFAKPLGLKTCQKMTAARASAARARWRDVGGAEGLQAGLEKIRQSPFLLGDNDRGWMANIDFFLRESSFTKLMEGSYDGKADRDHSEDGRRSAFEYLEKRGLAKGGSDHGPDG